MVYQFAWEDMTRYHCVSGLRNSHLFLRVLEAGEPQIKVPDNVVSAESPLLACGQLSPCRVVIWWVGECKVRESTLCYLLL